MPNDIPELEIKNKKISALDFVVASGVAKSKSEARRLIEQGGFEFSGKVVDNPQEDLVISGGEVAKIGKKRFFKVIHR